MKRILLSLTLVLSSHASLAVERVELCDMAAAIRDTEPDTARQVARIRAYFVDKQVVAVNGYLGCSGPEFQDIRTTLQAYGVNVPVTSICPPSHISIENNVDFIVQSLRAASARSPGRKIVLLGQSKGGAEVLQTLADHPDVIAPNSARGFEIAAAVTLSAAIGGSVMADLVLKTDPDLIERWEEFKRRNEIKIGWFKRALELIFFDPTAPGFQSLSIPHSKLRNASLASTTSEATRRQLEKKLFFVTAVRDARISDVPMHLKMVAKFMSEQSEENDGLVYEKDQRLDGFGTHLLEVRRTSHFSLIGSYGKPECRQEFARLLFLKLAIQEN